MTTHSFDQTKRQFKSAVRTIADKNSSYEVSEAALPAYAHANPLIDYIFWKRVQLAYDYAAQQKATRVLDFGCGSGVLSHALASAGHRVTAIDLDFRPLKLVQQHISFPPEIQFVEGNILTSDIGTGYDLIVALDVLEHIEDLGPLISRFAELLTPAGRILISGPTENWLYKLGRRLAGQRFTGEYHVSNIHTIQQQFHQRMITTHHATLLPVLPLFELFTARLSQ